MSATLRICHGDVDPRLLSGRAVRLDGTVVGVMDDGSTCEFVIPTGTHVLRLRDGIYNSAAVRFVAWDEETTEFTVRSIDAGLWALFQGGWTALQRTSVASHEAA